MTQAAGTKISPGATQKPAFIGPLPFGASGSVLHPIDHDGHAALRNELQATTGRDGCQTRALCSQQNYVSAAPNDATQSPYEIVNIRNGRSDLYLRYWIKLNGASLHQPNMWRTFFEWKSKGYGSGNGFRLISFIYTNDDGAPYFV